jgi:tetratricopeptide (TPR) repeat protein
MWLEQLYGNALFSAGRIDEALQHYEESCAIQPRTEYCHYNIAHILSGRGQLRDAVREYQLALAYTANRDMALLCLNESGEALMQLGDYDTALKSFSQALNIDPGDVTALRLRDEVLRRRRGGN